MRIDLLRKPASVDFGVLLSRVFDSFCRGSINIRILPLQKESKIGQKNCQKRRSLDYARGLIFLFFAVLLFHGCSCSRDSTGNKTRIGVDPSWYPLNFGKQTAYVNGFTEDLLLEIAKEEKIEFERIDTNFDNLIPGLKEGKFDAILTSLHPFEFNVAMYDFSSNFLALGPVLIVSTNSPYKKLNQIRGEAVGIISGESSWDVLQKCPQIIIRAFATIPEVLDAIANGEIAGALLDQIPSSNYVSDLYSNRLKIVSGPLSNEGLHMIARKGEKEELVRLFDHRLKILKKKKMKQLLKKWSLSS